MTTTRSTREPTRPQTRRRLALAAVAAALASVPLLLIGPAAEAGIVPTVGLGTASDYSVLAASTVTNTGPSIFSGSVGLSPGASITGFPPGVVLPPATIQTTNAVTVQAQNDLTTAYVDAAGRPVEFTQTNPDLVGQTLLPGVYAGSLKAPLGLSGQLVLDGGGDPNAVFIFQTDSTLITSSGSSVALINGASECNVFWQVGSSATLGSGSVFVGNILALTSVTVESAVVVHGRALARTGAVTLDNDTFTQPSCTPSTDLTPPATTPTTVPATTTPTTVSATTAPPATTAAPPADTASATTAAPVVATTVNTGGANGPGDGIGSTIAGSPATSIAPVPTTRPFVPTAFTLPTTGPSHAESTALWAGAVLLLGGLATVLARRRRTGETPD